MEELDSAQWYVLQVISGKENSVVKTLSYRIEQMRADGVDLGEIELLVPTERVQDMRDNKKTIRERKLYPGYVFIKMFLYRRATLSEEVSEDAALVLVPELWTLIRETNGAIGLIGGDNPVPLSQYEVDQMLRQVEEKETVTRPLIEFTLGEIVTIRDGGAFENIEGTVVKIDEDRQTLGVSVSMFGSSTIVELDFRQVGRT